MQILNFKIISWHALHLRVHSNHILILGDGAMNDDLEIITPL